MDKCKCGREFGTGIRYVEFSQVTRKWDQICYNCYFDNEPTGNKESIDRGVPTKPRVPNTTKE
jgi:hypothetical protein